MINSKYISVGVTLISSGMIFNNNSHFNPRKLSFENKNIIETSLGLHEMQTIKLSRELEEG